MDIRYNSPVRIIITALAVVFSASISDGGSYQIQRLDEVIDIAKLNGGAFESFFRPRLNDTGQIAGGYLSGVGNGTRVFQYDGTQTIDHGRIGGGIANNGFGGINNTGQLALWGYRESTDLFEAVRMETSGSLTFTGTLGGFDGRSSGINSAGTVIGHYQIDEDENERAFTFNAAGELLDLGTLGGDSSRALGINDLGQVVGRSRVTFEVNSGSPAAPFIWTPENGMEIITDVPGNRFQGNARDINESGWVVGDLRGDAFIRTAEGMFVDNVGDFIFTTQAGNQFNITTSSSALKMLEADFVAFGTSTVNDGSVREEPWRWTAEGGTEFFDEFEIEGFLEDDWDFFEFYDANEIGQILALAKFIPTGENYTVLLNPVMVPEPGAGIFLLATGWLFVVRRNRRKIQ